MDIANKKRTYVWGFPLTFLGKETARHLCFEFSFTLYYIVGYYFFG